MKKLLLILATAFLASCVNPTQNTIISPEGCLLYKELDTNGNPYYAGACLNGSYIIQWTQADASYVRFVYNRDNKLSVYIRPKDGEWTRVEEGSGVNIPGLPPGADAPSSGPIK